MKCLIVTSSFSTETNVSYGIPSVRMALDALGISHRRATTRSMGSLTNISATYDFIIVPVVDSSTEFATYVFNQANITIPVFVLNIGASTPSTALGSTPGVSGTISGVLDYFLTPSWSAQNYWGYRGRSYTPDTGIAQKVISATSPITGSAQAGMTAGDFVEWYTTKAGAGNLYVSVLDMGVSNPLAEMIQTAYNAGDFTAAQMSTLRRAPVSFDLDHINDPTYDVAQIAYYADSDIANFDRMVGFIPDNGVVWCGIGNGTDDLITGMGAVMKQRLQDQSGKKLRYCYHTHSVTRPQPDTGTWPALTQTQTKTQQDSNYSTDKSLWEAQGLTFHTPAYYNNGSYVWDEDTLALFSEDTSLASSPGNDTSQAGYGFRVFRGATTSSRKIVNTASGTVWKNHHAIKQQVRNILFVSVSSIQTAVPMNSHALWLAAIKLLYSSINSGSIIYLHTYDFKPPQDPLTNNSADQIMTMLNELAARTPDVCHFFADPLNYWAGGSAGAS